MATKSKRARAPTVKIEDNWRVEGDLSTLMEAEKIKADPKRLAAAQALAKQKMMAAAKVAAEDAD